jgi:hypothetical protein
MIALPQADRSGEDVGRRRNIETIYGNYGRTAKYGGVEMR